MCDPTTDKSEWKTVAGKLQSNGFHVLIFDYRSFGESEGERPKMMGSIEDAMIFWRESWLKDVESAYEFLLSQKNVNSKVIGVGGASCGVFMGLELTLNHPNVKTFVSLGGPIDQLQQMKLRKKKNLPILIISANEGPALEWSDDIFSSSQHVNTRITKYKYITHGTKIFEYKPIIQDQIVNWFEVYLR